MTANDISMPGPPDDFYRRMFDKAAVAMIATDAQLQIVCWNDAATALLGQPAADMLGRPIDQAVPQPRQKLFLRLIRRTMQRRLTSQFEVFMEDLQGKGRDLMVVLSPIPDKSGMSVGVAAWIVDQSQRKLLAERLSQAEKMASLGTLAGGVAHHFNNILGGVTTFVDFALTSDDTAAMRRALQMTAQAASRASKITQSLLSFAEQDAHRTDLADLTEVVLTFAHMMERPLAQKNIKMELDLKPIPIVAIEGARMHQAMGNLLTNAQEAMPDGGTIRIALDQQDNQAVLTFCDTGEGIKPEHLGLVFEPFFTTKGLLAGGDTPNTGLGLSVVHGIIVEMGGRIEVQSTLGQGTAFMICFPLAQ